VFVLSHFHKPLPTSISWISKRRYALVSCPVGVTQSRKVKSQCWCDFYFPERIQRPFIWNFRVEAAERVLGSRNERLKSHGLKSMVFACVNQNVITKKIVLKIYLSSKPVS
jgi:hypothetical protein